MASLRWYLVIAAFVVQAVAIYAIVANDLPAHIFHDDMASLAAINPLTGLLSNLGALMWSATVGVCALTVVVLKNEDAPARWIRFFTLAAVLTAYLMIDDFFMLHEDLWQRYVGVGQRMVVVSIVLATGLFLLVGVREILESRYGMLVAALVLLGWSAGIDQMSRLQLWITLALGLHDGWRHVVEDAPKWLGIACWLSYFTDTACTALSRRKLADAPVRVGSDRPAGTRGELNVQGPYR